MATEKTFNTRLLLKYDSYANWTKNNPTLLAGEIAIAKLTTDKAVSPTEGSTQEPVLFKVGPGNFNDLEWVYGLAADVYEWAKKENPDWSDFPALPLEIIDNQNGTFVTDITYANNKLTITRSNYTESNDYGKVTGNTGTTTASTKQDTLAIKGNGVISTAVTTDTVTISADLSGYKTTQNAVSTPNAEGNALAFIDTISQNAQGVITVTKKNVDLSDYATKAEISTAMVFKGTLGTGGTVTSLPTASANTIGDTYKVITAGTYASQSAKAGDTFICSSEPAWVLIPSGDEPSGTVTNVATGDGLTGGPITSTGTISHAVPSGASAGKTSPNAAQTPAYGATFNIPVITTDKFGHVTAKSTTTVKIPDAPDLSGKADKVTGATANNFAALDSNGNLIDSGKKASDFKTTQTAVSSPNASGDATAFIDTISQDTNGKITVTKKNVSLPTVNNVTITVNPKNGLELTDNSDGKFTLNQSTQETINFGIANKGVTTAKLADAAVGAEQTKAYQYRDLNSANSLNAAVTSEEVWVFYCGNSTVLT